MASTITVSTLTTDIDHDQADVADVVDVVDVVEEDRRLLCPAVAGPATRLSDNRATATLSTLDAHVYPGGMTRLTLRPSA